MASPPGPATLWGILESEHSPISAPPAENITPAENISVGVFDVPAPQPPLPNPARELFGDELELLEMPPCEGSLIARIFYHTASAEDFIRLNHGLFNNAYPHVRDVACPGLLLVEGIAPVEYQLFNAEVVVLVARGITILVHVEMLRPLPHLYWMFVDPRDNQRHSIVYVLESADVWKIALMAVYGTKDFHLNDLRYTGEDYIAAILLVQQWEGRQYVLDTIVGYLKTYFTRVAMTLRSVAAPVPGHEIIANAHDHILGEIQRCWVQYQGVHGRFRTLPMGAFGTWAVCAIYPPHLVGRMHHLVYGFRQEIALALAIQASAHIFDYSPEGEPIFFE
ncbi:hypothetical protein F5Y00DRAFT_268301 [Daldinia vernicosa]|uniref:uncharacterized protein n=1 Tax=Daldinia vernicosa TaxID=114800 RepID=UPI0020078914|nr:uncharacterized protein F5Y00DRAFT_268301 [Daldinia vernicosa]KAI0850553.1 hypothetical protein F5Y00DRAFT_268301 [Daldinia vernicosa]